MKTTSMSGAAGIIRAAVVALVMFTLLTGVVYPAVVTGLAQVLFPVQANGSLVTNGAGEVTGSSFIGQEFDQPQYFWGRLSATGPVAYNAAASAGSNLGPLNPALIGSGTDSGINADIDSGGKVPARVAQLRAAAAAAGVPAQEPVPVDLVTASGSGLDPHISPAAAHYQAPRVAAMRGISLEEVEALIAQHTEGRTFGLLGEPRVNVLLLNMALDNEVE